MSDEVAVAPERKLTLAERACLHILERIQRDPDIRYHFDLTEAFDLLCAAEAELRGELVIVVRARRQDNVGPRANEEAREEVLERRVRRLEDEVEEHESAQGPFGAGTWNDAADELEQDKKILLAMLDMTEHEFTLQRAALELRTGTGS